MPAKVDASQFAGMFLTYGTVFPGGATEEMLLRLYRPRPGLPFTPYLLGTGSKALMWTTFTPQQIDVDVSHPATRACRLIGFRNTHPAFEGSLTCSGNAASIEMS
jgi:sucrose phosphorylase